MRLFVAVFGVSGLAFSMGCKSKCQVGFGEGPDGNCYPIQMDTAADSDSFVDTDTDSDTDDTDTNDTDTNDTDTNDTDTNDTDTNDTDTNDTDTNDTDTNDTDTNDTDTNDTDTNDTDTNDTDTDTDTNTNQFVFELSGNLSATAAAGIPSSETVVVEGWDVAMLTGDKWPDTANMPVFSVTVAWSSSVPWSSTVSMPVEGDSVAFFAFYDSDGDGKYYTDVRGRYDNGAGVAMFEANSPYSGLDIELDQ